ncbi:MAG: ribosome silencing factor [Elusimicrobiales bacterium]
MAKTAAQFKRLADEAAKIADDKKAEDIKVLKMGEMSPLADYVVIASCDSAPQLEAVEHEISKKFKERGIFRLHGDGADSEAWRVLDYGGVLVHLMTPQAREFYALEKIYSFAAPARKRKAPAKRAPRKMSRK